MKLLFSHANIPVSATKHVYYHGRRQFWVLESLNLVFPTVIHYF